MTSHIQVQASASTLEMDSEEYRQLGTKCWSKFYGCCREYQDLASRPMGVFQDPGTGMGILLKQGLVSFLKPGELTDMGGGVWGLSALSVEGKGAEGGGGPLCAGCGR